VVREVCEVQRSQISVQCSAGLWVRSSGPRWPCSLFTTVSQPK